MQTDKGTGIHNAEGIRLYKMLYTLSTGNTQKAILELRIRFPGKKEFSCLNCECGLEIQLVKSRKYFPESKYTQGLAGKAGRRTQGELRTPPQRAIAHVTLTCGRLAAE